MLAEKPWNARASANTHGARPKQNRSVAAKANVNPTKHGNCREELRSVTHPAMAIGLISAVFDNLPAAEDLRTSSQSHGDTKGDQEK